MHVPLHLPLVMENVAKNAENMQMAVRETRPQVADPFLRAMLKHQVFSL
jgi:hypothetical protein